jgi:hypothetical protein
MTSRFVYAHGRRIEVETLDTGEIACLLSDTRHPLTEATMCRLIGLAVFTFCLTAILVPVQQTFNREPILSAIAKVFLIPAFSFQGSASKVCVVQTPAGTALCSSPSRE